MRLKFPVKHRRAGFTLIELTIVLVIIAIMSAMIVAEMSGGFQDALLRASSRQLIGIFSLASSRAISVNRLFRVRFDRVTGRYVVEQHVRGDHFIPATGIPESEDAIDPRIALRIQEPPEMEMPGAEPEPESEQPEPMMDNSISFYPDGTADGREVELRDREGSGLALMVSPITARVRIIELARQ